MRFCPANGLTVVLAGLTIGACSSLINTDDYTFVPSEQDDGGADVRPDASRPTKPMQCADADDDGVCDRDDVCPDADDALDDDADGVPDGCDACAGYDDALDDDADGVPDGCDCDQSASDCVVDASCADGNAGVDCSCNPGFGGDGKSACTPGDCNAPDAPLNGQVDAPTTHPDDVASYSCATGYALVGASTSVCQHDGTWSESTPSCDGVDCGALKPPSHANIATPDGTRYPNSATYSCRDGYALQGEATRSCTDAGTWSGSAPSCQLIDCGGLVGPAHGTVMTPDGTRFANVATYACLPGYVLAGSVTRTCQADDSWSDAAPTCGALCSLDVDAADSASNNFDTTCALNNWDPYMGGASCLDECSPGKATDEDFSTRSCLCNTGMFDQRPAVTETFTQPAGFTHASWTYKFDISNSVGCTAAEVIASCFNGTSFVPFDNQTGLGLKTVTVPIPAACILPSTQVRVEQHLQNCTSGDCANGDHYVMYYDGRVNWQFASDAEDSSTNDFSTNCATNNWDPYGLACLGQCSPAKAVDEDFNTRSCLCDSGTFDEHPAITETFTNPAGYTDAAWTYKFDIAKGMCEAAEVIASCFNGTSFIVFDTQTTPGLQTATVPLPSACVRPSTQVQVQQRLKNCGGDCMIGDHYVMYYEGRVDWDHCQ